MSAVRFVSAALVMCASGLFGEVRKARLRKERSSAEELLDELERLERMMRLERIPLDAAAARLAEDGASALWEDISLSLREGDPFEKAYSTAKAPSIDAVSRRIMDELASALGSGELESETSALKRAAEELGEHCRESRKKAAEKEKLTGALSLLFGAAAALLMI